MQSIHTMIEKTPQMENWAGEFGKDYTDRNPITIEQLNALYVQNLGITRDKINELFFKDLQVGSVLEVGSNVGVQLISLHDKLGLRNLYGVEIQNYAVDKSKELTKGKDIHNITGSALNLPFKDKSFDLVMTNGVLIHISPEDINKVMEEMHRCAKKYIFGYEYFAEDYMGVDYRGNKNLLWKTNFAKLFLDKFPDLSLVKEDKYPYLSDSSLKDQAFLLVKDENTLRKTNN